MNLNNKMMNNTDKIQRILKEIRVLQPSPLGTLQVIVGLLQLPDILMKLIFNGPGLAQVIL